MLRTDVMLEIINIQATTISQLTVENKVLRNAHNDRNNEIVALRRELDISNSKLNKIVTA